LTIADWRSTDGRLLIVDRRIVDWRLGLTSDDLVDDWFIADPIPATFVNQRSVDDQSTIDIPSIGTRQSPIGN